MERPLAVECRRSLVPPRKRGEISAATTHRLDTRWRGNQRQRARRQSGRYSPVSGSRFNVGSVSRSTGSTAVRPRKRPDPSPALRELRASAGFAATARQHLRTAGVHVYRAGTFPGVGLFHWRASAARRGHVGTLHRWSDGGLQRSGRAIRRGALDAGIAALSRSAVPGVAAIDCRGCPAIQSARTAGRYYADRGSVPGKLVGVRARTLVWKSQGVRRSANAANTSVRATVTPSVGNGSGRRRWLGAREDNRPV